MKYDKDIYMFDVESSATLVSTKTILTSFAADVIQCTDKLCIYCFY